MRVRMTGRRAPDGSAVVYAYTDVHKITVIVRYDTFLVGSGFGISFVALGRAPPLSLELCRPTGCGVECRSTAELIGN